MKYDGEVAENLLDAFCPGPYAGGGSTSVGAAGRLSIVVSTVAAETKVGFWCGQAQQVDAENLDLPFLDVLSQQVEAEFLDLPLLYEAAATAGSAAAGAGEAAHAEGGPRYTEFFDFDVE